MTRWLPLLLTLLLVAGCGAQTGPVTRAPSAAGGSTGSAGSAGQSSAGATTAPDDLASRKAAAGIADCPASDPSVPAREDGLPDLTLPCLGGGQQVRLAGLRGTPLVVNVWAQWCGPCRTEAPHLAEVSQRLAGKVDFLGVDYVDPRPDWAIDFADEADWHYPQVTDEMGDLRAPLAILGPPMTLFVDADGRIVHKHPGVINSTDQLESLIADHLGVR